MVNITIIIGVKRSMIEKVINLIFKIKPLRQHIFAEVDLYNSVSRTLKDPYWGSTATAVWSEDDGWRGWTKTSTGYYFVDYPEMSLSSIMEELQDKEDIV